MWKFTATLRSTEAAKKKLSLILPPSKLACIKTGNKVVESDQISSDFPRGRREHHADSRAQCQKDAQSLSSRIKLSVNVRAADGNRKMSGGRLILINTS